MKAWLMRLALSFIITLGFTLGRSSAQAPLVPPSQPYDFSPIPPLVSLISRPQPDVARVNRPGFNVAGYCCDSDLHWYGCGGLRAQWDFTFGSCRTFFGEACVPMPHGNTPAPSMTWRIFHPVDSAAQLSYAHHRPELRQPGN